MMASKTAPIPVNPMADEFGIGISIERIAFANLRPLDVDQARQTHRHDGHSFVLLEKGTVWLEIDFEEYQIKPSTLVYVHPDQVHRTIASENVTLSIWTIIDEKLNHDYLNLLEEITPTQPIEIKEEIFAIITDAVSLCLKYSARKHDKLYHAFLKDSCNALVALVIGQFLEQLKSAKPPSRFDAVYKAFRKMLEQTYRTVKRPTEFAQQLNVSTPYLTECVRSSTGFPVSYHIQQRIVLEAKRLLVHSDQSVKEIATALGYDDYPYFSRLFSKVTGMTPLTFRRKNLD